MADYNENLGVYPVPPPTDFSLRIKVIGPNGEVGTVPAHTIQKGLPPGWKVQGQITPEKATIGPPSEGLQPVETSDIEVPGGGTDIFDTGLKKKYTFTGNEGENVTVYPPEFDNKGYLKSTEGARNAIELIASGIGGFGAGKGVEKAIQRPIMRKLLEKYGAEAGVKEAGEAAKAAGEIAAKAKTGVTTAQEGLQAAERASKEGLADTMRAMEKRVLAGRAGRTATEESMFREPVEKASEELAKRTKAASKTQTVAETAAAKEAEAKAVADEMARRKVSMGQTVKEVAPALGAVGGAAAGSALPGFGGMYAGSYVGSKLAGHVVGAPVVGSGIRQFFTVPLESMVKGIESPGLYYNLARIFPWLGAGAAAGADYMGQDQQSQGEVDPELEKLLSEYYGGQ